MRRRLQQIISERTEALRELGADADDIEAWTEACSKQFLSRLSRRFNRLARQ